MIASNQCAAVTGTVAGAKRTPGANASAMSPPPLKSTTSSHLGETCHDYGQTRRRDKVACRTESSKMAGDERRSTEDTRADHRVDHQRRQAPAADRPHQTRGLFNCGLRSNRPGHGLRQCSALHCKAQDRWSRLSISSACVPCQYTRSQDGQTAKRSWVRYT